MEAEPTYPHDCPTMVNAVERNSSPIVYSPRFREFGVRDVGPMAEGAYTFAFCPFCGLELPASLRSEYFDELEALGFDDLDIFTSDDDLPAAFRDDTWW
jgi:hypothetical protein